MFVSAEFYYHPLTLAHLLFVRSPSYLSPVNSIYQPPSTSYFHPELLWWVNTQAIFCRIFFIMSPTFECFIKTIYLYMYIFIHFVSSYETFYMFKRSFWKSNLSRYLVKKLNRILKIYIFGECAAFIYAITPIACTIYFSYFDNSLVKVK